MRELAYAVVAALIGLCIGLSVAELVARAIVHPQLYRREPQVRYDPHPVRSFSLRPCQTDVYTMSAPVTVDCDGHRVTAQSIRSDRRPVVALGDSFTFGMGVRDEETWPSRVETLLAAEPPLRTRVLNAGTISYGVFQEMHLLKELLQRVDPDLVVHALYWNDYQSAGPPSPSRPSVVTPQGYLVWDSGPATVRGEVLERLKSRSSLAVLSAGAFRRIVPGRKPQGDGYAAAYERLVSGGLSAADLSPIAGFYKELSEFGKSHGFRILVVVLPVQDLLGQADNPYRTHVTSLLDRLGLDYVDGFALWNELKNPPSTFLPQGRDSHLSAEGYELLSRAVVERISGRRH